MVRRSSLTALGLQKQNKKTKKPNRHGIRCPFPSRTTVQGPQKQKLDLRNCWIFPLLTLIIWVVSPSQWLSRVAIIQSKRVSFRSRMIKKPCALCPFLLPFSQHWIPPSMTASCHHISSHLQIPEPWQGSDGADIHSSSPQEYQGSLCLSLPQCSSPKFYRQGKNVHCKVVFSWQF